jgi:hypothetical protein
MKRLALLALTVLTACSPAPEPAPPITPPPLTSHPPLHSGNPFPLAICYSAQFTLTQGNLVDGNLAEFCLRSSGSNGDFSGEYSLNVAGDPRNVVDLPISGFLHGRSLILVVETNGEPGTVPLRLILELDVPDPRIPPTAGTFILGISTAVGGGGHGTVSLRPHPH